MTETYSSPGNLDQVSLSWLAQDPEWGYFRQPVGNLPSVAKVQECFIPPPRSTHVHILTYADMDMYAEYICPLADMCAHTDAYT